MPPYLPHLTSKSRHDIRHHAPIHTVTRRSLMLPPSRASEAASKSAAVAVAGGGGVANGLLTLVNLAAVGMSTALLLAAVATGVRE